jgi:hypothetical protein
MQLFAELRYNTPAAPHAFHENGLEGEGSPNRTGLSCRLSAAAGRLIAECGFQIGKFVGSFCETPFI